MAFKPGNISLKWRWLNIKKDHIYIGFWWISFAYCFVLKLWLNAVCWFYCFPHVSHRRYLVRGIWGVLIGHLLLLLLLSKAPSWLFSSLLRCHSCFPSNHHHCSNVCLSLSTLLYQLLMKITLVYVC